ncbi:MAG: hypothetical protein ABH951_00365 [Patescibacteria group bacterium]
MQIVTVMPFKKGLLKEEFTYFSSKNIEIGSIVDISIRNKKNLGLVVYTEDVLKEKSSIKDMPFNLKKINEVKEKSIFLTEFLESLISVSKYFAVKKQQIISLLIPSVMIDEYDEISKIIKNKKNSKNKKNKIKNIENNIADDTNIKSEKEIFQASLEDRIASYKILIRSSFAEKKSIFMILPTEKDIENFYDLLSKGLEDFVFKIHGNITKKKQIEIIKNIISCDHPVIVLGTAPFLSIPRKDFKTIILEHESSNSYKTIKKPNLNLKIFAEVFAFNIRAKLILADTFLSLETIARKEIDNLGEITPLSFKTNFNGEIKIFDKNELVEKLTEVKLDNKKFKILTQNTKLEIQKILEQNQNIFIFALRKGLATMTICRDCAELVLCEKCLAPVTLYKTKDSKKRIFICNKCGTEKSSEITCRKCNSWNLIPLGIGTDTVYEEIKKLFPKTKIFKLDRESVKTTKEAEKIIKDFEQSKSSILIGTEMALHYLKEKLPLTVIASFDSLWSIPNFRISEKIIHILISILSKTKDQLIIETKNKEDSVINAVKIDNLVSFVREELEDRKKLGYPPYKRFIKISFMGNKLETENARKYFTENFKEYNPEIFSGFLAKLKDKFITNCLIKTEPTNWSIPELSHNSQIDEVLSEKLLSLNSKFLINIDPEDII